jgi:hypothetical protein
MLRVSAAFHQLRFLQTTHLLFLLVLFLVLSVLILFTPMEHAKLEQIEFGATRHASVNELQTIHIPLQRTIAPRQCQPRKYCIFVLLHAGEKRVKCLEMAGFYRSQPGVKLLSCARQPPSAEICLRVERSFQCVGLPASKIGDSPARLLSNPLACGKRARWPVVLRGSRAD